jgi:hypothetical protein
VPTTSSWHASSNEFDIARLRGHPKQTYHTRENHNSVARDTTCFDGKIMMKKTVSVNYEKILPAESVRLRQMKPTEAEKDNYLK